MSDSDALYETYIGDLERLPVDLMPLILLELRLVKSALRQMILSGEFDEYAWENLMQDEDVKESRWREQMKRLGHWDERYES